MNAAKRVLPFFLIALVGALVFGRTLAVGYLADDYALVGAATSPDYSLSDAFPAGRGTYFRPAVIASLRLESLFGGAPLHHAVNLGLHIANAVLVVLLARRLFDRQRTALVAGLAFLLHPIVVTDAMWISGRTDSLAAFFALGCILALAIVTASGSRAAAGVTIALFAAALLAKEIAIATLPIAAVVWWRVRPGRVIARNVVGGLAATAVAWLAYVGARFYRAPHALPSPTIHSLVRGVAAIPASLVFPNEANLLRPLATNHPVLVAMVAAGVVVGLVILRRRLTLDVVVLATAPLVPLLLTVNPSSRLMYFPLAFLCIAVAGASPELRGGFTKELAAVLAILGVLVAASISHGRRWLVGAELAREYCEDFRGLHVGGKILLVTYPNELDEAPLLANDAATALHYCLDGTFGELPIALGEPVDLERVPESPIVRVHRAGDDVVVEGSITKRFPAPANTELVYFDGRRLLRVP